MRKICITQNISLINRHFLSATLFILFTKVKYSRSFIRKSKRRKHPNNVTIEGRFGIVVPKATTTVSNFLTSCAVVDCS
jgi:hypothetical protein